MKSLWAAASKYYGCAMHYLRHLDGLGPLVLRLYIAPIFIYAGWKKIISIDNTIEWFGNSEWGLGLPFPELMGWAAALTEFGGGIALLIGLGVRVFSIPLMTTMLVAAVSVHLKNGWQAVADPSWLYSNERVIEASERLAIIKDLLNEHGNYEWLTEYGNVVILNNGIEFAATYGMMCFVLLFTGGGRYVSADYWIAKANGSLLR